METLERETKNDKQERSNKEDSDFNCLNNKHTALT